MEKRSYTVEWLSESSKRTCDHSKTDFLTYRTGHAGYQIQERDCATASAGGQDSASTSGCSQKEKANYTGNKGPLEERVVAPQSLQELPQEMGFPSVEPPDRASPSKDYDGCSDVDSLKSTESITSEDDSLSSRPRTKFTEEQLQELEKSFKENRYIGSSEKKRLSKVLKLSETQIKTWFQNRRMKFKRQRQDARVDAFFSRLYFPYYGYPDVQNPSCSLQPELPIPVQFPPPPQPTSLPFNPMNSAVRPGIPGPHTSASIVPPANYGSCPLRPMILHPMLNEPSGLRFNPY